MSLKIILAEKDPLMRPILRNVFKKIDGIEIIGEEENPRKLIEMVEEMEIDAVFLDIDMPKINGINASQEIFNINPKIFIIVTTSFSCYAFETFEAYAFDYLVKPFNLKRVRGTITRICQLKEEREQLDILQRESALHREENLKLKVLSNDKSIFINVLDIILITRIERKTIIHLVENTTVETNETMQKLEERLDKQHMFRCHKGFIINPHMVEEISPWGNKSYLVKLANTKETALMTLKNTKEFQKQYCL